MKANFPVDYMAAILTADSGDVEKIAVAVAEAKRMNIAVLPPDVNESGTDFTVVGEHKDTIRFGLSSIKNFGEGIARAILEERLAHGPYASLADFLSRVGSKNLNRKSLESLIKCGALDSFESRGTLLAHIDTLLEFHRETTTEAPQDSLFGGLASASPALTLTKGPEISLTEKLVWEKELLGIYVSGHPLDAHENVTKKASLSFAKIKEEPQPGLPIILPVLVAEVRTVLTKNGEKMAFVKFEDKTGSLEAVVFPKLFKEHALAIIPGACLLVKGNVSNRNNELSLAIDGVKPL
jgi:DNA polymerase-3 subunit alpha